MEDWSLPIIVSHGEGRASFENEDEINKLFDSEKICMTFVDSSGYQTEQYPLNPNKSPSGITGITNDNGNITIMMPHPKEFFVLINFHGNHYLGENFLLGCRSLLMLKNL